MKNKVIIEFIKREILETFQSKEVVKRNLFIIAVECILAYFLSRNNQLSEATIHFYQFQMFLTTTTIVFVSCINSILIKYNAKKNNTSNYSYILKYSQYLKFSVFSGIFFQSAFILIKVFKVRSSFITILGFLVFLNTFLNLIFSVNTIMHSFEEPDELEKTKYNKVNLTKKDSY